MSKGHNVPTTTPSGSLPADAREALTWFVNTYGLYVGSTRGLFITDWAQEQEASLEASTINLKSRGFHPLTVSGDTIYKQADYLWKESRAHTNFGRPLASKLELEMGGSDVVIVDNLEAPENSRHLWYLWSHLLYPRAISGRPTIITTPLSFEEFVRYGDACHDPDFCGNAINWEKFIWLIEASMITVDVLKLAYEQGLPPMLKAEYYLYAALKERGLEVVPQHVLSDFILDFALIDKDKRLDIEVDTVSTIGSSELQRQEATRNLVLFADGWQVLKFTTGDILSNRVACVDVVDDVWRSGRKRGGTGRLLTGNMVPAVPDLPVDDDTQLGAITFGGGPAAVCGGAGTGKTTCLIQRVRYLLGEGINPENILVLTHATDTQRALKRSIEQLIDKQAMQRLSVFSWQDLGLRILKENMSAIKRKPPLKIEPSPQKIVQRLLAKIKKEIDPVKLELSVDLDEFYIAAVISMYKAHLISPNQAKEEAGTYGEEIIAKIYQQLEDQLQKANRIDRDDAITLAVQVLLETPDLRARYQRQFEFVLIDEYQDVTVAQDMLGRLVAAPQDNVLLVGDEDETVCEAKNACPELFTELSLRMPQARCFTLEKNWRSHPAIVDHARQLAAGLQKRRVDKEYASAWGQAPASAIVGPASLADEFAEANWVAQEIQLLVDSGRNYGEIAILFRHHVYATILEEALDQKNIHYQASNPIANFIPDEVEDMMAFLKLVVDPDGPRARESFERVCQLRVKEIDPKLSGTIASFGEANNLSYLKAVEIYSEATADQSCRDLEQLVRVIRTMHQEKLPPAETIALIRRTQRLNEYYRTVKVPAGVNYEPLKKLTQLEDESKAFKTIAEFIKHISAHKQSPGGVADQGVQVLPILDSKGLEFPVVFLVGMAEGIFPAQNAIDLEEERRICYVGFTRAKELLYLSYPQMFSGAILQPSHFLVEARLLAALPAQMAVPSVPVAMPDAPQSALAPESLVYPVAQQQPAVYDPALYQAQQQPAVYDPALYQAQQQPAVYDPALYQAQQQQYPPVDQAYAPPAAQAGVDYGQPYPPSEPAVDPQMPVQPEPGQHAQAQPAAPGADFWSTQPQPLAAPADDAGQSPALSQQWDFAQPAVELFVEPAAEPPVGQPLQSVAQPFVEQIHTEEPLRQPQQPALAMTPDLVLSTGSAVEMPISEPPMPEPPAVQEPVPAPPVVQEGFSEFPLPPELVAALEPLPPEAAFETVADSRELVEPKPPVVPPAQRVAPQPADPFKIYTGEPESQPAGVPQLPRSKGASPRKSRGKEAAAQAAPEQPGLPASTPPQPPLVMPAGPQHHSLPAAARHAPVGHDVPPVPTRLEQELHKVFGHTSDTPTTQAPIQNPITGAPAQRPPEPWQPASPQAPVYRQPQPTHQPAAPLPAPVTPMPLPAQSLPAPATPMPLPAQPPQAPRQPPAQPVWQVPPSQHVPVPSQPLYPAAAGAPQPASAGQPLCPACHMPLEPNARFCSECGFSLPTRIPACPTCSAPLEPTAKFCGECGVDLTGPVAGDSMHVSDNMQRMHNLKEKQAGWVNKIWKMLES